LLVDIGYILLNDIRQFLREGKRYAQVTGAMRGDMRTLISTGRSSNKVFRLATFFLWSMSILLKQNKKKQGGLHWASLPSFMVVTLMSLAIAPASLENSLLLPILSAFGGFCRCFSATGAPRYDGDDERVRMDSTQVWNSRVRSCVGIVERRYRGGTERVSVFLRKYKVQTNVKSFGKG
jgi:hypothetical protein